MELLLLRSHESETFAVGLFVCGCEPVVSKSQKQIITKLSNLVFYTFNIWRCYLELFVKSGHTGQSVYSVIQNNSNTLYYMNEISFF